MLTRFEEYKKNTLPLIEYYKTKGVPYFEFVATTNDITPEMIFDDIAKTLDEFLSK